MRTWFGTRLEENNYVNMNWLVLLSFGRLRVVPMLPQAKIGKKNKKKKRRNSCIILLTETSNNLNKQVPRQ